MTTFLFAVLCIVASPNNAIWAQDGAADEVVVDGEVEVTFENGIPDVEVEEDIDLTTTETSPPTQSPTKEGIPATVEGATADDTGSGTVVSNGPGETNPNYDGPDTFHDLEEDSASKASISSSMLLPAAIGVLAIAMA